MWPTARNCPVRARLGARTFRQILTTSGVTNERSLPAFGSTGAFLLVENSALAADFAGNVSAGHTASEPACAQSGELRRRASPPYLIPW